MYRINPQWREDHLDADVTALAHMSVTRTVISAISEHKCVVILKRCCLFTFCPPASSKWCKDLHLSLILPLTFEVLIFYGGLKDCNVITWLNNLALMEICFKEHGDLSQEITKHLILWGKVIFSLHHLRSSHSWAGTIVCHRERLLCQ